MEVRFSVNKMCVGNGGMLRVGFYIEGEAGNYDSKSTCIMTLIKQEKLVFILVMYTFGNVYVFLQNCLRIPEYPVPDIIENAALIWIKTNLWKYQLISQCR